MSVEKDGELARYAFRLILGTTPFVEPERRRRLLSRIFASFWLRSAADRSSTPYYTPGCK
jgi:hypothetical protein